MSGWKQVPFSLTHLPALDTADGRPSASADTTSYEARHMHASGGGWRHLEGSGKGQPKGDSASFIRQRELSD